jgi:heat-inducible transcriptional repressor
MVKNIDHQTRRKAVLASVINRYIDEAVPVASEELSREFDLSSATIRNIFAELEDAGYLTHPYTSAGKIPTNKGYRYYVDFLLSQLEVLDEEKERIVKEYRSEIHRLEDVLEDTSEVISRITHYTGIVSFLEWQDRFFYKGISFIMEQPEFKDLDKMRILIRMIEDKRRLIDIINRDFNSKVKVYIGEELGCAEMQGCSLVVSTYSRKNRPSGRIAVLGPMRMGYGQIIPKVEYVSDVVSQMLDNF